MKDVQQVSRRRAPAGAFRLAWGGAALCLLAGTPAGFAQAGLEDLARESFAGPEAPPINDRYFDEDFDLAGVADAVEPGDVHNDPDSINAEVRVDEHDLVDLHVNDENLGTVLQLLSIQSQRNIITSGSVRANVTADLYGVTFYEALDAILHANGFGYIERGHFIYVYTREELLEIEAASRQRAIKVIRLNYLNAIDAAEFVRPLLSENGGQINTNGQTSDFNISGDTPVGADTFANDATLVIYDYEENIEAIQGLLRQLDTKPVQVLVEATILQTSINEANAFGVDFSIINNLDFKDFVGIGGPLDAAAGLISGAGQTIDGSNVNIPGERHGTAVSSNIGNVEGPSTLKAGIVNKDVAVFLRLLDQVTDVTVVSNPKILTLNRQPARVLVGTRVGYLSTTATDIATTQSVEFLDTGTQLSFRPFVSDQGLIRLELKPQVSTFTLREVTDNTGGTVTIPDEDTTELVTNVMVRDGQTVVLGGLFTEMTTATRRQVPVLGDIPLIGKAFRGHDDSTRRSEIIFMITPSIVNDEVLTLDGERAQRYTEYTRVGARRGLLPWSRERQVGQLLIEARNLEDDGRVEEALFKIQRALALQPTATDAISMRERLTNRRERSPSRSIMEGILHDELNKPLRQSRMRSQGGAADGAAPEPSPEPDFAAEPVFEEEPGETLAGVDEISAAEPTEPEFFDATDAEPEEVAQERRALLAAMESDAVAFWLGTPLFGIPTTTSGFWHAPFAGYAPAWTMEDEYFDESDWRDVFAEVLIDFMDGVSR